jgi:hypothetical protein
MGRHGANGEEISPDRGNRGPESPPEQDRRDEPVGRRLRPEESVVTEPRTGFLGSGWTSESEPSGSADPWPEDEKRSGGRVGKTLLAVAAVAVLLGGTVAGVRVLTGSEKPADCPATGCVTAASNRPAPAEETTDPGELGDGTTDPGDIEDTAPSEEPPEAGDEATAAPTPAVTRRGGGVTAAPRPTATRRATRAPRTDEDGSRTRRPSSTDEPDPGVTTAEPLVNEAPSQEPTGVPTQVPSTTAPAPDPVPSPDGAGERPAPLTGGAAITVGADLMDEEARTYTVQLVVAADANVGDLTVSVPVSGRVSELEGAEWRQDGDDLVIESEAGLEAGEPLVVTFTAQGDAEIPRTCRSDQGKCSVG